VTHRVRVVPLQHGLGALDYADPFGLGAGDIVRVPLGPRELIGAVWEAEGAPAPPAPDAKLRAVAARLDAPPLSAAMRQLISWVADYYIAPLGSALRLALPSTSALEPPATVTEWALTGIVPDRLTPARARALDALAGQQGSVAELAGLAEVSDGVIRGLIREGALAAVTVAPSPALSERPDPDHAPPTLEAAQADAAAALAGMVRAGGFRPTLLEGVTGSGKTEVYFEAAAEALRQGGQALVLLPEIALTAPFLARCAARFGAAPLVWHSGLKSSDRRRAWRAAAAGGPMIVVGARSALFLPFPALKLIVVDEAHEAAFKQEDGVRYHGRDAAIMRASFEGVPIVLATATPTVEMLAQVEAGRYAHLQLPARFGGASLPAIRAVDLKRNPPPRGRWLSPPLVQAVSATLEAGEQALLFLNRRGYAPLTLCRACGGRIGCPNCSTWLVEHRLVHRLQCHHCGHAEPSPPACPHCGTAGTLAPCGPGVERVAEEAARTWPNARIAVAASDTLGTPQRAAAFVRAVEEHEIDLIVGTQLVAKGHDFPALTCVGVVDADLGLAGGDLRAAERTFAMIAQAAGRAGRRAGAPGRVLLQTYDPSAPVIRALANADATGFRAAELTGRRLGRMPPFGRLIAVIVQDREEARGEAAANALGAAAPQEDGLEVFGPAVAPLSMLRGWYRWRFLVHARRGHDAQGAVRRWLGGVRLSTATRIGVDVDPYNFL
jgi:primosomal protein N' (replication factor Y)